FRRVLFRSTLTTTGFLDVSAVSSFTANFDTINVGVVGNPTPFSQSFSKMLLPGQSNITAATSFIIGDSGGSRNQQDDTVGANIQLTTGAGGTTTIRTPIFAVGRSKTSASLILGAGNTFDLSGVGVTPRAVMGV